MDYNLEEGQIVLCTVEKIVGTTVFVHIEGNGEGTITTSEISPGRIRNLRDYVVPGKKVVCKILNIREGGISLSLRRVKQYERKELLDKITKERGFKAILKTVLGDKAEETIKKITEDFSILEFFEKIKDEPKLLEKLTDKKDAAKILKILESKKEKQKEIRQIFKLSNKESKGINTIKDILQESCKGSKCQIAYLAAGKYSMTLKGDNFKEIKGEVNNTLESIEKLSKKNHCDFEVVKG
jgi:translation initiation factor 2 alpha subunit (eIF-2alpha)